MNDKEAKKMRKIQRRVAEKAFAENQYQQSEAVKDAMRRELSGVIDRLVKLKLIVWVLGALVIGEAGAVVFLMVK